MSVLPSPAPSDEPSPAVSTSVNSPNPHPASLPEAQRTGQRPPTSSSTPLPVTEARFVPSPAIQTTLPSTTDALVSQEANGTTPPGAAMDVRFPFVPQLSHFDRTHRRPSNKPSPSITTPSITTPMTAPAPTPPTSATTAHSSQAHPDTHVVGSGLNALQSPTTGANPTPLGDGPPAKRRRTEYVGLPC